MSGSATVFPSATYTGGQTCAPVAIDDASTLIQFSVLRDGTSLWSSSAARATATIQVSFDGVNWQTLVSFVVGPQEQSQPKDTGQPGFWQIGLPPGTGRQARVTLGITNGFVHTTGTLTWQ